MCCRGLHAVAKPAYLSRFLFSALLRVARHCVPGGVRMVSISLSRPQPAPPRARYGSSTLRRPLRFWRRAHVLVCAREAVAQHDQHGPQLLTLVIVEPGEQYVFGRTLSAHGPVEVPLAGRVENDDVAAVGRVALA